MTPLIDAILDKLLPGGRNLLRRVRSLIVKCFAPNKPAITIESEVRSILRRHAPELAAKLHRGLLTSFVLAAHPLGQSPPPRLPTSLIPPASFPEDRPRLLYQELAASFLESAKAVPPSIFHNLDASAKRSAEFIAHAQTEETARRLSNTLADSIREGKGLRAFQQSARDILDGSPLSDWALETTYRTNGGRAYAAGQQFALSLPVVRDGFPYVAYFATHDDRTEHNHLMMERLGLDGTNIYRRDDPVIIKFWPPWRWSCRCHAVPINIAEAARRGVREAQQWLDTGRPPAMPEYVAEPPFDLPRGWAPVVPGRFPTPMV